MQIKLMSKLLSILMVTIVLINDVFANEDCIEKEVYCSIPNQTKKIRGTQVHRDCWEYKYKLDCKNRSKDDCSKVPSDICAFILEECIDLQKEGESTYCANLRRRYSCEKIVEYEEEHQEILKNGNQADSKDLLCKSMCLDGNCINKAKLEENDELAQAVGMLNGLAAAKKGIDKDLNELINVFKGEKRSCSYHPLSFMNCCKTRAKGWGEAIKLGQCKKEELGLAKARRQKRCVDLGEYCKTKILGACIDKRKVLCCYDSVIARILNQEAKKQLGRGFGTAKNPQCEGFSMNDLKNENLDLSKADFRDFYDEIVVPNIQFPDIKIQEKNISQDAESILKESPKVPDTKKGFSQKTLREMPE